MSSYLSYGRPTALILLRPDHTIVLRVAYLGWQPLQTKQKKAEQKLCISLKTKWVLHHSQIYFHMRLRKQITTFAAFLVVFVC